MNESHHRIAVPAADMEPVLSDAPLPANGTPAFTSRVNVHVINYRRRITDPDGISCKAVLDAIVHAGILADDSSKQIKIYSVEVRKAKVEKTIIEITPARDEEDDQ